MNEPGERRLYRLAAGSAFLAVFLTITSFSLFALILLPLRPAPALVFRRSARPEP